MQNEKRKNLENPIWAAWLACAIDCEGSIYVTVEVRKNRKGGVSIRPSISVGNDSWELVKTCQEIAGDGGIGKQFKAGKDRWQWRVKTFKTVPGILQAIREYLVVKRDKADLILELSNYYKGLIGAPLKDPRPERGLEIRKRVKNRGTGLMAKFLLEKWFPAVGGGEKSEAACRWIVQQDDMDTEVISVL